MVRVCMDAGLAKGEGFAVDASVMEASASRYHGKAQDEIEWAEPERQTRAVKEYLAAFQAFTCCKLIQRTASWRERTMLVCWCSVE
jgi:hypothetical protein